MATKYASHFSTRQNPQSEAIPGSNQVKNSAGGFAFPVDDWTRLDRFLILGNEGGSYYATEKKMTVENAGAVQRCFAADPARTINRIVEISDAGRAPKNDPAIFALAICSKSPLLTEALPKVCRTGTHLFQFAEAVQAFRGWGPALRKAVGRWYTEKSANGLAYQVTKYQQRNGWSHRDLLRLAHPKTDGTKNAILRWVVGKQENPAELLGLDGLEPIIAMEKAKTADKKEVCRLIREFGLVRECIPTQFLTEAEVWDALLEKMPMTAMVRNLATMTKVGLLAPMSAAAGKVLAEIGSEERIQKSRLHPIALLTALLTYKAGRGQRSDATWSPVAQIVDALDGAFYKAFANVDPTGKRWMLAMDVSGSMNGGTIAGVQGLTPRVGSSAMALVTAAVEKQHHIMAFSRGFVPLSISPRQRLDDVCAATDRLPFDATDCAVPMKYALENKIPVDVFVIYTDSETWCGHPHPTQALQQYRERMGIAAKLVVVGMVSNGFTIADPNDAGMMDVVGFDTNAPAAIGDFAR